jgi:hypothetical protein
MDTTVPVPLIDEAALYRALELAPGGGTWEVTAEERVPGTGRDLLLQVWQCGDQRRHVAFHGPTVVGLSDNDLEAEAARLRRVRDAAEAAIGAIEGHLRYRRSLP